MFDPTIHAAVRLRISGLLRSVARADFGVLRDTLEVSDATLSKHLRVLVEAGYVTTTKAASLERGDARRITWVRQTAAGRAAFDAHMQELRRIADGFGGAGEGLDEDDAPARGAAPTRS